FAMTDAQFNMPSAPKEKRTSHKKRSNNNNKGKKKYYSKKKPFTKPAVN
ncbi:hypothetical protein SAMN02745751_02698, partial [Dethiosulfatibacter aminovorans DSM 17477]